MLSTNCYPFPAIKTCLGCQLWNNGRRVCVIKVPKPMKKIIFLKSLSTLLLWNNIWTPYQGESLSKQFGTMTWLLKVNRLHEKLSIISRKVNYEFWYLFTPSKYSWIVMVQSILIFNVGLTLPSNRHTCNSITQRAPYFAAFFFFFFYYFNKKNNHN